MRFSLLAFRFYMRSFVPIFLTILFLVAGEGSIFFPDWRLFFILASLFAGVVALFTWQLRFLPTLLLTFLVVFAGISFFLFAFPKDSDNAQFNIIPHLFIALWALALWLTLEERVRASRGVPPALNRIQAIIFTVMFLFFAASSSALGAPFFIDGWVLLLMIALCESIAIFIRLEGHTRVSALTVPNRRILLYSIVTAMLISEAFLAMSFWPFAPLTVAAVLITIDYALANLFIRLFRSNLRIIDVLKVSAIFSLVLIGLLIRGPWLP